MTPLERAGLAVLARLDPERAHGLALRALRLGLGPSGGPVARPRLGMRLSGLKLANPVGLAAGFDKNAVAVAALARAGFGWVEVGAATPRAQPGNPRPRLFRLLEDGAVINRFGFNNDGVEAIAARLARRPEGVPVGINLGAMKGSSDPGADFAAVLASCGPHVDFATLNVSSPNTPGLRDLQGPGALGRVLAAVLAARDGLARRPPVFLKIAPDLSLAELAAIAATAEDAGIDGIVATNTTTARESLKSASRDQAGGLSGAPLFDPSTRVLAELAHLTGGRMPLIGVGGIVSAADAYAKIRAGASAVQLYTGLVTGGLSLAGEIARGLDRLLAADGFARVADAVGTGTERWRQGGTARRSSRG